MVDEEPDDSAKLKDFRRNPSYESRVVVFYDFLGWRSEIAKAGTDPQHIGDLRRSILMHTRMLKTIEQPTMRVSTFSDNIVISVEATEKTITSLLRGVAVIQILALTDGHLIRGGITLGDLIHDDEVVFGPALNRAYYLESAIADYPSRNHCLALSSVMSRRRPSITQGGPRPCLNKS